MMNFKIRERQEERGFRRPEEALGAISHEISAVDVLEVDRPVVVIEQVTFIRMRSPFESVRTFPETEKSATVSSRNGTANLFAVLVLAGQVPLADVVGAVPGLA